MGFQWAVKSTDNISRCVIYVDDNGIARDALITRCDLSNCDLVYVSSFGETCHKKSVPHKTSANKSGFWCWQDEILTKFFI